jgi:hypothetical protein
LTIEKLTVIVDIEIGKSDKSEIMTSNILTKFDSIVIGTGNILENEEFKKAKNPTQEVSEKDNEINFIWQNKNS